MIDPNKVVLLNLGSIRQLKFELLSLDIRAEKSDLSYLAASLRENLQKSSQSSLSRLYLGQYLYFSTKILVEIKLYNAMW